MQDGDKPVSVIGEVPTWLIMFAKTLHFYFFPPCFSLHPTFNLPVQGSEELSITLFSCEHPGNTLHTLVDTNTKKKRKKEKSCFNSRAKASSSVLCYTVKLTLGMFVIVLPMKLHCNPFQLPPSLTHPPSSSPPLPFQRNCSWVCFPWALVDSSCWQRQAFYASKTQYSLSGEETMEGRRGAGLWEVVVVGGSQGRSLQQTSNFKILVLISSQKESERQTVRREGGEGSRQEEGEAGEEEGG